MTSGRPSPTALVRRPSPRLADGLVTHIERTPVDAALPDGTADLLNDLGWQPVVVDIGEFEKLEGCVTCLSVRLRDLPSPS